MNKQLVQQIRDEALRVAQSFKATFTTEDLVRRFSKRYPQSFRRLVRTYGRPGRKAGTPYTAASRLAHMLLFHANRGRITRLGYVGASYAWGSPWVLQFER